MSKLSSEVEAFMYCKRFKHKRKAPKPVDRSYTNFAGSNAPPLTKEQWDKGMALSHKMKNMSAW